MPRAPLSAVPAPTGAGSSGEANNNNNGTPAPAPSTPRGSIRRKTLSTATTTAPVSGADGGAGLGASGLPASPRLSLTQRSPDEMERAAAASPRNSIGQQQPVRQGMMYMYEVDREEEVDAS